MFKPFVASDRDSGDVCRKACKNRAALHGFVVVPSRIRSIVQKVVNRAAASELRFQRRSSTVYFDFSE